MDDNEVANRRLEIGRFADGGIMNESDMVAVEKPMEIRLDGHPVAVLMRTPGDDDELVSGFLVTEGILKNPGEIRKTSADGNRFLVFLEEGVGVDVGRLSRNMYAGSSCGICGKATLEAVFTQFPRLDERREPDAEILLGAPEKLRAGQEVFSTTGGLHAAGLFGFDGELIVLREDIGRHNAVDKVIGHALRKGIAPENCWLLVSGRVSFDIMQKSLAVGMPFVAAISAPSSLAVEFAKESGQGLVGFLRPPGFNRYA